MAKPHILLPTVCAALLAALCAASEVPSTVVTTADDVVDPEDGVVSLREAVAYAGTGTLGNTITLTNDVMLIEPLVLTKSVIINGIPGRDRECAVTINSLSEFSGESAFVIPSTSLVMFNNLTLYGGVGRAIENAGDLRLRNITIDNNYGGADIGGGIYNTGTLFVSNAVVSFSSAFSGGGLYNAGAATIVDTVFDFCTAGGDVDAPPVGGAIRNTGTLVVRNCLFFGCDASGDEALPGRGGAIHNTGRAVIDGATFTGMNGDGGGTGKADVWNAPGGDLQINNSTFFFETSADWCPPVTGFVRNESGASLALLNSSFAATGPIAATSTNTYRFVVIDSAPAKALVLNCAFTETQADAVFGAANATVRGCAYGRALGTVFQTRVETYNDPPWENTDLRRCISGSFLQICPYPVAGLAAAQPGVRLRNADGALQWLDGSVWTDANVTLPDLPDASLAADLFGIERAPDAQGRIFPGAGASPHGQESVSAIVTTAEDIVDPYDGLVSFREAAVYGFYKNYFDFMGGHSDYIEFSPDLHNQDIVVTNGPVRIDGHGANITVSGPVRLVAPNGGRILELFNMQSCSLEQGLVFADATSDGDCGALYAQGIGQLYVNAATFTNCVAAGSGGAIWFDGGEPLPGLPLHGRLRRRRLHRLRLRSDQNPQGALRGLFGSRCRRRDPRPVHRQLRRRVPQQPRPRRRRRLGGRRHHRHRPFRRQRGDRPRRRHHDGTLPLPTRHLYRKLRAARRRRLPDRRHRQDGLPQLLLPRQRRHRRHKRRRREPAPSPLRQLRRLEQHRRRLPRLHRLLHGRRHRRPQLHPRRPAHWHRPDGRPVHHRLRGEPVRRLPLQRLRRPSQALRILLPRRIRRHAG